MDDIASRAVVAAVAVAGRLGLRTAGLRDFEPRLIKDGSNAIIHLFPSPIVARVSTTSALIRTPPERWLKRDLDLAAFLVGKGLPVVPPTPELPPGPHLYTETAAGPCTPPSRAEMPGAPIALTFWTWCEHDRDHPASRPEAAALLGELHAGLRDYPGELPFLGVLLDELPHWLKWLEIRHALPAADLIALRQAQWSLAATLRALRLPFQPLHGDAHAGNLLRTPKGLLWTDFEDACIGPRAWDVAALAAREPGSLEECIAAYLAAPGEGTSPRTSATTSEDELSWRVLHPFLAARALESVLYHQVLAQRFPHRAREAAAALENWYRREPT